MDRNQEMGRRCRDLQVPADWPNKGHLYKLIRPSATKLTLAALFGDQTETTITVKKEMQFWIDNGWSQKMALLRDSEGAYSETCQKLLGPCTGDVLPGSLKLARPPKRERCEPKAKPPSPIHMAHPVGSFVGAADETDPIEPCSQGSSAEATAATSTEGGGGPLGPAGPKRPRPSKSTATAAKGGCPPKPPPGTPAKTPGATKPALTAAKVQGSFKPNALKTEKAK